MRPWFYNHLSRALLGDGNGECQSVCSCAVAPNFCAEPHLVCDSALALPCRKTPPVAGWPKLSGCGWKKIKQDAAPEAAKPKRTMSAGARQRAAKKKIGDY